MARIELNDGKIIEDFSKPYFIAEVNSSHNGNIETAKAMIAKAKEVGCDCVKFQSWSAESLYSKTYYDANPISKRIVSKFAFSEEQFLEIIDFCSKTGISFASTPYSEKEVDFLIEKGNVPFIKIASMDINNLPFLEYIARKDTAIILSTGMSTYEEVNKAVNVIKNAGNSRLILLHCISLYPVDYDNINLRNIFSLRNSYPDYAIGFSDHSLGYEIPCAASALGAAVIEKHFTLDKSKIGMDNQMATEPDEFKKMIECCGNVVRSLGSEKRIVSEKEQAMLLKMRRSVVARYDLTEGTVLKLSDFDYKRPGNGVSPDDAEKLVGKKLNKAINADYEIHIEDTCVCVGGGTLV